MNDLDGSIVSSVLNDLLQAVERIAESGSKLSEDHLLRHVGECEGYIGQLKTITGTDRKTDGREGARTGKNPAVLELDESITKLISQVNDLFQQCIGQLAERRQKIAGELEKLRSTQRAARAYRNIRPA